MSKIFSRLIVTCSVLFFFLHAIAQLPGYKTFKLEKDNRQVKINILFKNIQGYLFAGTDNGLYKFDGEKYTGINFENSDYQDTVTAIFQDRTKKMWFGFKSGRIANLLNKKLRYFDPEEGTPKKKITAFLQDKENNLWFSTNGEGVYYIKNNRLYLINAEDDLSDENVSSLLLADNGDILAGTDQGINICSVKNGRKNITVIGQHEGLPDYLVTSLEYAGKNTYWIGLQDKGFCLYDHSTKKITIPFAAKEWQYGQINSMLRDENILWLATQDNGLFKYHIDRNTIESCPGESVSNHINSVIKDNQGNIWLSSPTDGMIRTPGERLQLLPVPASPIFEHIHAILTDKSGNIWLNNKANDLLKIGTKNNQQFIQKLHLPGLTEKTDITALYQDAYGTVWVGTIGKGLFIVDPVSLQYRSFTENSLFINAGILSINGRGNAVYVSSLQGAMMIALTDENTDIKKAYRFINYNTKSTGTNYIYTIFKDGKNRTWFGTDGKGLTMEANGIFTYYNSKEQIKDDRIYSVTEDNAGNIWFSTSGAGLYRFDGKTFTNYGLNEGLSDLNVSVLKTDKAGNIIIVHKKGLDILDPVSGYISYVNKSQGIGMVNAEDIGAVTKDTSGNVMVSTSGGILTYSSLQNTKERPTAIIESVQLFLKDLDDSSSNVFAHDENNFTFNYTGLYYTDPEKVYYRYKLEGFDTSWVITKDRNKNFPKLLPGKYSFHIQASLNKNFKNADEAFYSFVIKQAFYKTFWFIGGCILLLAALLYRYIKSREMSLKRIERLRQDNIQFQFEMLRNQVNPHFLFNSFNTLISTIEEDPVMAVEYAEQLSDFFRNVVNQRDKELVSLKDEIDTLHSYSFLQQKRYGDNLQVNLEIAEEQKVNNKIPPLTLQLLMENAIKHNVVSKETPLYITLSINSDGWLDIKNNLNHRLSTESGAGMGLQNIINRYRLLINEPVRVINDGQYFIVSLPLLK